jgi:hypothetical protein
VISTFSPILHFDQPTFRQTEGHLLTLGWNATNLEGQVSLFNYVTYKVLLCRFFAGVWRPIRSGVHFNVNSMKVDRLTGVAANLMP